MNKLRQFAAGLSIAAFVAFAAAPASATTILTFGQALGTSPISSVNNGAGSTTLSGTNILITVSQIDAAIGTPFLAFFTLSATSVGAATLVAGNVVQEFSGSFTITSAPFGGGTNFLSGSFTDAVFGLAGGASLTLSAAEPPQSLSFSSDVIPDLGLDRGMSLSFANVSPPVGITNGSLSSFTSSVSGTFSANVNRKVPEPASLALVGLAMLALAMFLRRRSR